jgi:hypothetical protein
MAEQFTDEKLIQTIEKDEKQRMPVLILWMKHLKKAIVSCMSLKISI